ncbi:proline-rich transmembrane protein 4 [Pelodytes ibericus]
MIMGSTHWTCLQILILTIFHLSNQEVDPTKDLILPHAFPSTGFISLIEYLSTLAPESLQNTEATSFPPSQKVEHGSVSPTHDVSIVDSEQLQTGMLLHSNAMEEDVSVLFPTTIIQPVNRHLTEMTTNEPSTLHSSQLSPSALPEIPSELTSLFTTAVQVTLAPAQETPVSLDTAQAYSMQTKSSDLTVSTSATVFFSLMDYISVNPSIQSVWPLTESASQEPEVQPSELSSIILTTSEEHMDENIVTEGGVFGIIHSNPEEASTDVDEQLTEQINKETSISPSLVKGNAVTSDDVQDLHGSTSTVVVISSWECDLSKDENCNFTATASPAPDEANPKLHGRSTLLSSPPIFINLHSDWNTSVADWGVAWEALVYGAVGLFGTVALLSLLCLFCLVFRCPLGSFYLAILHLLLICIGSSRAFALFYDAYGHQDRLPIFTTMLLHDLAFPCMTSSFSVVFLLLSSRCNLQHSSHSFPRLCILSVAAILHFIVSAGAVIIVVLLEQFLFLLLVSRGVFVVLTVILSLSFFIYYCLARTQNTQIYDLKSSAPPTDYTSGCPFANAKDWSRVACIVLVSAFFGLLNSGLQLYAVLYAMGYGGSIVFGPWPWWALQLSFILCEVGMCLPLAVAGAYPIFCANDIGRTNCWTKLFRLSPGHVTMKAPILASNSQWASSQHEKLLICDTIVRSDSEFFPLYTLVEKRMSTGEDLSLIYHSSKSLEVPGLSLYNGSKTPSFLSVHIDSDSTVDFRPPSPINLRRSIDEALFSESLIPQSLFHGTALSSSLSLTIKSATQLEDCVFKEKAADRGLYRTSSCMEIETGLPIVEPNPSTNRQNITESPSPGTWRGGESTTSSVYKMSLDGSSLVLCSSPEHVGISNCNSDRKQELSKQSQGVYHTLSPPSQESLDVPANATSNLRGDLIDVFGPIDALSVGSDTIDL